MQYFWLLLMNRLGEVCRLFFSSESRMILNSGMGRVFRMRNHTPLLMTMRMMICLKIDLALPIILTENLGSYVPSLCWIFFFSGCDIQLGYNACVVIVSRPRLKEHMQYCMSHPEEMSKLSKLKAQITEVKGIMMDNIEKVRVFFLKNGIGIIYIYIYMVL